MSSQNLPKPDAAKNMTLIGHSDQGGRPDGVQLMVNKGHAFIGHMFSKGFSVVDCTNPRDPKPVTYVPAPHNTWNIHLQTHGDLLLVIHAKDMFAARLLPDLGGGILGFSVAMVGWDFLYYWSHRLQHELRYLWAIHVVHHSSERYNLSTALRQPVAESFGTMMPYGILGLIGVRPDMVLFARGANLIWQFWIHTEVVRSLGIGEEVLSTPSAHRVHHGSNRQYLDRNHGGILIIWDRIFGTFEREDEAVVYGLTTNIESFNPWVVATHEYRSMFADVSRSTSWFERFGHVVGPPGWRPAVPELAGG